MTIQYAAFTGGGFVLHNLPLGKAGRASAWFDVDGVLLSAERFDTLGRAREIREGMPLWAEAQAWGKRYHLWKSNPTP